MLRTGFLGPAIFRVIRLKSVTLLPGASFEYNASARMKVRAKEGTTGFDARNYINRFSLPLHLQISISKKQFAAFGFFGSYDLKPKFKGESFDELKQVVIGISGSLIL